MAALTSTRPGWEKAAVKRSTVVLGLARAPRWQSSVPVSDFMQDGGPLSVEAGPIVLDVSVRVAPLAAIGPTDEIVAVSDTSPPATTVAGVALRETRRSGLGSRQSIAVVAETSPAAATTLLEPGLVERSVKTACPPAVGTVADAGSSAPVPLAVNVTGVPLSTGWPLASFTTAVTFAAWLVSTVPAGSTPSRTLAGGPASHRTESGVAVTGSPEVSSLAPTVESPTLLELNRNV